MAKRVHREPDRCTTSVKPLGRGRYGARVFYDGRVIMQDNSARSRAEAAKNLKELLRMTDKMGYYDCPMAAASRFRFRRKR